LSADGSASADAAPQFVTALQEQLGLKLVPEKTKVTIFVIDHIERPTPNQ
jgi:bla regulator protein BlaR1